MLLFLALSPLFVIIMLYVRISMGSPVFFTQLRSGKGMEPFRLIKFRSMAVAYDECGKALPDEQRLTKAGQWLRSSSLDELPELLNIIKGDMSVIGPRPLPVEYDDYYRPGEKDRFLVRGGLIPPDSIDPDPIISWDRQLEYESEYGRVVSFRKDVTLFCAVFRTLFIRNKLSYGDYVRQPLSEERKINSI